MNLLFFILRASKGVVLLSILTSMASGASSAYLIAQISEALTGRATSTASVAWAFVGLCLAALVTRFASQVLLTHLAQKLVFEMRKKLCDKILGAPLRQLEELGPPRLLASLTDDSVTIANALISAPLLVRGFVIILACLGYLAYLSVTVLIGVVIFLLIGIGSYQIIVRRAVRYFDRARDEQDVLFAHFRAVTEGTKELKLHRPRREAFINVLLHSTLMSLRRLNFIGSVTFSAASSWGQVLFFALIGTIVFVMPILTDAGARTLTGYTLIILYMMTPIDFILNTIPTLSRASVALHRIEKLGMVLVGRDSELALDKPVEADDSWEKIELVGVTHSYHVERENSNFTLGPIDLAIRRGETVFLVGGNGSGKTTLAKLLVGLYMPEAGKILIDGREVTEESVESYRQCFTMVFSDFYLFESLLGVEKVGLDGRAKEYLNRFQLDHKVEIEDGHLSTTALSQGQRKRLALLTAYMEDRSFYVFDEWAADQDPIFKKAFYTEFLPDLKRRGKTVLVISHDDHYYHLADRMIKLDSGQIDYDKVSQSTDTVAQVSVPVIS